MDLATTAALARKQYGKLITSNCPVDVLRTERCYLDQTSRMFRERGLKEIAKWFEGKLDELFSP